MAGIYAKLYCKSSEHDAIREFVCFTGRSNHTITGSICNETMRVGMSVEDYWDLMFLTFIIDRE